MQNHTVTYYTKIPLLAAVIQLWHCHRQYSKDHLDILAEHLSLLHYPLSLLYFFAEASKYKNELGVSMNACIAWQFTC